MDRTLRIRMLLEAGDRVTRPLRDMASGSVKAAQALKATRDRLKEIDRAQADIAGFRALKTGLRTSGVELDAARARATALGRELAQVEAPTRKLSAEFNRARREAQQLENQHQQNSQRLGELRNRLRDAGVGTTRLASDERRLRTEAAATNRELSEQGRRMQALNDRTRRLTMARADFDRSMGRATGLAASGAAAIGTGVAVATPVVGSIKAAQDYQSVMTTIAQKANMTRTEADRLGKSLMVSARAANQLPDAMQAGVDTLAGLGARVPDAVAMMQPIGRAATAYKAEIADLAAASYAATDNLKVPVAQTGRVIEMMAAAGKAGAFELKDMATYFPALSAAYQGLGQTGVNSVGDIAAALQITRKGTGSAEVAATNLQNVLQKMASPDTIKKFKKFGVDIPSALKQAYKDGKTPIEAIAELTNTALGGDLSKIGFLFEDAQVQQGLRPLIQNLEEYRRIRAEAQGAGSKGTVDRDFAERMKDSAEQTRQLQVNAATLGVTLGSTLLPTVNAVLGRVNAFANRMATWAQANPGFAKAIALAAALLAGLFLVFGVGAIAIAAIMGPIAILNSGLIAMGVAGGLASVGLLPIIGTTLAVVAAIAGLVAIAYAIYKHWDGITAFFTGLWNGVVGIFTGAWAAIQAGVAGGFAGIAALFVNFSPVGLLYAGFAALMNWLGVAMPARLTSVGGMLINGLINGITGKLAALKNAVVGAANSATAWFKNALGIRSPSRVFMGLGGFLTEGLAIGIGRGASEPLDRVRQLADRVRRAGAVAGAVTLASPALAMSGSAPRAALPALERAGQAAESVFTPRSAATRVSGAADRRAAAAPAAASLGRIEITINQLPGQNAQDLARLVRQEIEALQRQDQARRRASFRDAQDYGSLD